MVLKKSIFMMVVQQLLPVLIIIAMLSMTPVAIAIGDLNFAVCGVTIDDVQVLFLMSNLLWAMFFIVGNDDLTWSMQFPYTVT